MSAAVSAVVSALDQLQGVLHSKIEGRPAHPWLPGCSFADGAIMDALVNARQVLLDAGVNPSGTPPR